MVEARFLETGLSAEYGDIVICDVTDTVTLVISIAGNKILQETYYPDNDGNIYIREVGKLAAMYNDPEWLIITNGIDGRNSVMNITISEGAQIISKNVQIFTCTTETAGTLTVENLKIKPLSRINKKATAAGRFEYLSFYGSGSVFVDVAYIDSERDRATTVKLADLPVTDNEFYRLNVSPAVIAQLIQVPEEDLIYYYVFKDKSDVFRFNMDKRIYPHYQTFVFRNSFGAQETFTCTGDGESERKWTREFATITSIQKTVKNQLENKFKINTGYMTRHSVELLEDLLNSESVCLIDNGKFVPVVFVGEKFTVTSRRDELIAGEIEYRYASNNQSQYRYQSNKLPRIFDQTFDKTFN